MIKVKAEMDQFKDGLQTRGFLEMLQSDPSVWESYFINTNEPLTTGLSHSAIAVLYCNVIVYYIILNTERMKSVFKVKFSDKGSNIRAKEEQTYVLFVDFMDECEGIYVISIDYNEYTHFLYIIINM